MNEQINIVWLKKDLRLYDHPPLYEAIHHSFPFVIIYILEPSMCQSSDWHIRHLQFQYHSIAAMNQTLQKYGCKIHIFNAEALEVFEWIISQYHIHTVFSHMEIGTTISYQRDKSIKRLFANKGICWSQYQNNGVERKRVNREGWELAWEKYATQTIKNPPLEKIKPFPHLQIPPHLQLDYSWQHQLAQYPSKLQPPGESKAWQYLSSFVDKRCEGYLKNISKPEAARYYCSRISPYLTWGNISTRQVYQYYLQKLSKSPYKFQLKAFQSRLQWRCHFIQKFEMEERIEFEAINRGFLSLHQPINPEYIQRWRLGLTGYPIIDAAMRCVNTTGYLNFRMRAMLVSFLTHLLWQPWYSGVWHLAQMFLDYEPGIHLYQFQMQAGVTGVNIVRIYNPIKQAQEHDKEGVFIKKWLPELTAIPSNILKSPWIMTQLEQSMYGCRLGIDYPYPIVEFKQASRRASEILYKMQQNQLVLSEKDRILKRHTNPKKI